MIEWPGYNHRSYSIAVFNEASHGTPLVRSAESSRLFEHHRNRRRSGREKRCARGPVPGECHAHHNVRCSSWLNLGYWGVAMICLPERPSILRMSAFFAATEKIDRIQRSNTTKLQRKQHRTQWHMDRLPRLLTSSPDGSFAKLIRSPS